jgi:hypothetical protein
MVMCYNISFISLLVLGIVLNLIDLSNLPHPTHSFHFYDFDERSPVIISLTIT